MQSYILLSGHEVDKIECLFRIYFTAQAPPVISVRPPGLRVAGGVDSAGFGCPMPDFYVMGDLLSSAIESDLSVRSEFYYS